MIRLSLQPSPASDTSAFNNIRAFSSRCAALLPLRISASRCSRSSPLSRTTYFFTEMSFAAMIASAASDATKANPKIHVFANCLTRATRAHIEGMGKACIIITEHGPSYEVWVEQDGRRFLFAIAGSLEDAGEEAREAGERIRDKAWPGGKMTPPPLQLATNRQRAGAPSPTTAPPLRKWKGPPGRDT